MSFITLPEEIYRLIQTFLTHDDNHYFLAANACNFGELRRKTIYFSLTEAMSVEYVKNPTFTSLVLSKVENGWKQISIRLGNIDYPFPQDLPVHKISFHNILSNDLTEVDHIEHVSGRLSIREIPPIPKIKVLDIFESYKLVDLKNLSHLQRLKIYSEKVTDITALQNISVLYLSNCHSIQDFDIFNEGKQVQLSIEYCSLLKDVSPLRNIRILSLTSCHGITDVSPLHGIYDLTLSSCRNIRDISKLGNHYRLCISNCAEQLVGFDSLYGIPHIKLDGTNISDLNVLSKAKSIWLRSCSLIEDVKPIQRVRKLSIFNCSNVKNIHQLADVPDLTLFDVLKQKADKNLIHLRNQRLYLCLQSNSYDLSSNNIRDLSISQCTFIESLLTTSNVLFHNLQSLSLYDCSAFTHVKGLGSIPTLRLRSCHRLKDISALGGNRCVELADCPLITDVSSLAAVPIVTIRRCQRIEDFKCLAKVERLKIVMYMSK